MNKDSKTFIKALETRDKTLLKKVPRTDVHNHAGLGGDFKSWIRKERLDIEENTHHFPDFTDFQRFVDKIYTYPYENPTNKQNRERMLSLFEATYELAVADGVTYIEPGIDALIIDYFEGDINWMTTELKKQIDKYSEKLTIKPDVGMIRVFPMDEVERTIYPCIESASLPH